MSICPGCDKPMINGQAMNGLLKCHWDCQDIVKQQMGSASVKSTVRDRAMTRMLQDGITPFHPLWGKLMDELDKEYGR